MKRLPSLISLVFIICSCGSSSTESTTSESDSASVSSQNTESANVSTTNENKPGEVATQLPESVPYSKEVTFRNNKFSVTTAGNQFTLTPSGYSVSNDPLTQGFQGMVSDVKVDDIDGDNQPEVAVLTRNRADSVGKAYVYSSNGDKSISMVNLPEKSQDDLTKAGYQGRDEYEFVEGSFIRRFPKYKDGTPTGEFHQIQYRLKPGEASKQLVQYKEVDF